MRLPWSTGILAALLLLVQADLWLGKGNLRYVWQLQLQLAAQQAANVEARALNARIDAEVGDLVEGLEIVEERARAQLGMLKADEILVQVAVTKTP
ncbi:MAG: septum formation initiator family protein [Rubrivivax sp.]|nr:septum formation initiator family protein [Rubrivivax sp.]